MPLVHSGPPADSVTAAKEEAVAVGLITLAGIETIPLVLPFRRAAAPLSSVSVPR